MAVAQQIRDAAETQLKSTENLLTGSHQTKVLMFDWKHLTVLACSLYYAQ